MNVDMRVLLEGVPPVRFVLSGDRRVEEAELRHAALQEYRETINLVFSGDAVRGQDRLEQRLASELEKKDSHYRLTCSFANT